MVTRSLLYIIPGFMSGTQFAVGLTVRMRRETCTGSPVLLLPVSVSKNHFLVIDVWFHLLIRSQSKSSSTNLKIAQKSAALFPLTGNLFAWQSSGYETSGNGQNYKAEFYSQMQMKTCENEPVFFIWTSHGPSPFTFVMDQVEEHNFHTHRSTSWYTVLTVISVVIPCYTLFWISERNFFSIKWFAWVFRHSCFQRSSITVNAAWNQLGRRQLRLKNRFNIFLFCLFFIVNVSTF